MSKLWDDLKDNMKDWSVSAVEKAEEDNLKKQQSDKAINRQGSQAIRRIR